MRYYSSVAQAAQLSSGVDSTTTALSVSAVTGWPVSTPFTLVLDVDTGSEEIVTVTAVAGTAVTVVRGEDGSPAVAHAAGASIRHRMTARDLREPQEHASAVTGVHGLAPSSAPVGTVDTQTLINKTISGTGNTLLNIPQSAVTGLVTTLTPMQTDISTLQTDVAGKAPLVHAHTEAQVTGLTTDLAAKAPLVHTHAATDVTSGVLATAQVPTLDVSTKTSGTLPVARGGTGAIDAAGALTNLAAAPVVHNHNGLYYTMAQSDGRYPTGNAYVKSYVGQDVRLRYDGRPLWYVDGLEFSLGTEANLAGKVNTFNGSLDTAQHADGPGWDAYNRGATGSGYYAVYMNSALQFMRNTSSRRYKDAIEPAGVDVNRVLALEPVTFHRLAADDPQAREVGLIAEDCADVPFLVQYENGIPEGVAYETVLPVLLLAVVKAQQGQIDDLTRKVTALEGK